MSYDDENPQRTSGAPSISAGGTDRSGGERPPAAGLAATPPRDGHAGPLDGWTECQMPGCPSWDDDADPAAVEEFEDSDGWAHGVKHVHLIDHYVIDARKLSRR